MSATLDRAGLKVAAELAQFVETQVLPGLGSAPEGWWQGVADIFATFAPENAALLAKRETLQAQIDERYKAGEPVDEAFLREIGYLVPEPAPFTIGTDHVDAEIATMAGPQLVVPILNARFVLNAANARWGSLYDALYGTDALRGAAKPGGYDVERGAQVIAAAKAFSGSGRAARLGVLGGLCGRRAGARRSRAAGRAGRGVAAVSGTTGCISRSSSIRHRRSARATRRASPTSSSNRR